MNPKLKTTATPKKLKNGLTVYQVEKAKAILREVRVVDILQNVNVSRATLDNVLRGRSSRFDDLSKVLKAARVEKAKKDKRLKRLV